MAEREVIRFRADKKLIDLIDDTKKEESLQNRSEAIRFLLWEAIHIKDPECKYEY